MAWNFAIVKFFLCLVVNRERSGGLGKAPMKTAFGFASFFSCWALFSKVVLFERGKLFGHKTQLSPTAAWRLRAKNVSGKKGRRRESTALSLLKNILFKFSSKTPGEGGGHVDQNPLYPTSQRCAEMVHAQTKYFSHFWRGSFVAVTSPLHLDVSYLIILFI